jgi:hypothetical protein
MERVRGATLLVTHPRWEPYAGKPLVRFCAGGDQRWSSLPRQLAWVLEGHGRFAYTRRVGGANVSEAFVVYRTLKGSC